ncbi:MAG: amidohydrolase family protein [Cephaloticoccus sp.]|nr:amidohydrolase family protein [Cephaloticoccus sp.]MCF7759575.1 amidohydrolase family protein [Cephaloticoccus sp.]
MRIYDIHTHPIWRRTGSSPAQINRLIRESRALGITRVNILGDVSDNGPCQNAAQITQINEASAGLQAKHPDFFTFFCYLNPTLGERDVMREVERCVTRHGARGIKLEAANNAADLCMRHVAKAARTFNLVVLQHSWSMDTHNKPKGVQTDPEHTALFARRNPDVKIIMAHLVGCGYRGVIAAKNLPNLWVDTSGGYPEAGIIEYAAEHLGPDRILFGSDLPIREHSVKIGAVLGAAIPETAKQKILYDNAAKLVGLD